MAATYRNPRNRSAKLREAHRQRIKEMFRKGMSQTAMSKELGISVNTVKADLNAVHKELMSEAEEVDNKRLLILQGVEEMLDALRRNVDPANLDPTEGLKGYIKLLAEWRKLSGVEQFMKKMQEKMDEDKAQTDARLEAVEGALEKYYKRTGHADPNGTGDDSGVP